MRKPALLAAVSVVFLLTTFARAQQADVFFGVGTTLSPAYKTSSQAYSLQSEKGGAYINVGGDVIFKHRFGFNAEVAWKASQGIYNGYQPYRPILYDFNGVFQPRLGKKAGLDLMAGIGGESLRFYTNYYTCTYFGGCINYTSSNHFMGHVGGGIRYYFWGHFFVRPEAHLYLINNNFEFSSGKLARVGASIGYTLGPE